MSARTNGATAAPAAVVAAVVAPVAPAASIALGAVATVEKIVKGAKVFEDVPNTRCTLADGSVGAVQVEVIGDPRDNKRGPMMLANLRKNPTTGEEGGTRFPLAFVQRYSDALAHAGRTLIAPVDRG